MTGPYRIFVLRKESHYLSMKAFIDQNWRQMSDQSAPMQIVVSPYKAKRTLEQNALYWKRLGEIAENAWVAGRQFISDAWHAEFGDRFLPKIELPSGRTIPVSTTSLSIEEFTEYLNKIEAFAANELGVELTA